MLRKLVSVLLTVAIGTLQAPLSVAQSALDLPKPGTMVPLSPAFRPPLLAGITVHADDPFLLDFILDPGPRQRSAAELKQEGERLIKYFLAALAIPEKDLWVNLSPFEKDRMVPKALGETDMGQELLAQDYLLKQIAASLIYPESAIGQKFWQGVYAGANNMPPSTAVPMHAFDKIWITADRAEVVERGQTVFVAHSHLKVLLKEDDLAQQKHQKVAQEPMSHIIRRTVLPEVEREVNEGSNFAPLRQIYHAIILASWYKNNLRQALLNQVYADRSRVNGIHSVDQAVNQNIYERYLQAYRRGVFQYVREDAQGLQRVPRKYFSGGMDSGMAAHPVTVTSESKSSVQFSNGLLRLRTQLRPLDSAMARDWDQGPAIKTWWPMIMTGVTLASIALTGVLFFPYLSSQAKDGFRPVNQRQLVKGVPATNAAEILRLRKIITSAQQRGKKPPPAVIAKLKRAIADSDLSRDQKREQIQAVDEMVREGNQAMAASRSYLTEEMNKLLSKASAEEHDFIFIGTLQMIGDITDNLIDDVVLMHNGRKPSGILVDERFGSFEQLMPRFMLFFDDPVFPSQYVTIDAQEKVIRYQLDGTGALDEYFTSAGRILDQMHRGHDSAMTPGGIDLAKAAQVRSRREGDGVQMRLDPNLLKQFAHGIRGLVPVVTGISNFR